MLPRRLILVDLVARTTVSLGEIFHIRISQILEAIHTFETRQNP